MVISRNLCKQRTLLSEVSDCCAIGEMKRVRVLWFLKYISTKSSQFILLRFYEPKKGHVDGCESCRCISVLCEEKLTLGNI